MARGSVEETIAAIATAPGHGAIGIVRCSGPLAAAIRDRVFLSARPLARGFPERRAVLGRVIDPARGEPLDQALALWMPGPASYTGEDVLELHCHGGPAVLHRVLAACIAEGARMAGPGEFTRRAFLRGRVDLSAAEAICDLIEAETEAERRLALSLAEGGLGRRIRSWSGELLDWIAHIEAEVDFPEEEVDALERQALIEGCDRIRAEMEGLLAGYERNRRLRSGIRVALVGLPNVGKSSLLNQLLGEDRALVSEWPGTTRDVIEGRIEVGGQPVILVDTAGLRETGDPLEALGAERSRREWERADLLLLVLDAGRPLAPEERTWLAAADPRLRVAVNKVDRDGGCVPRALLPAGRWAECSALTGSGVDDVVRLFTAPQEEEGGLSSGETGESRLALYRERHREALERASGGVARARELLAEGWPADLAAGELRLAWAALGEITGETVDDQVLDRIFARFCIGK